MIRNSISILLTFLTFISLDCRKRYPTEDQLRAFRSAKTMQIVVNQSYGEAEGVVLPFHKDAEKLFSYAGIRVVAPQCKQYDISLLIECTGHAIGRVYEHVELLKVPRGADYHYTGASITGTISMESPGLPIYKKYFEGKIYPPKEVHSTSFNVYLSPSSAPFEESYRISSFIPSILELISDIYGYNCINHALIDEDPLISKDAAELLIKRSGKSSVEPLISALEETNSSTQVYIAEALGKFKDPRAVTPLLVILKNKDPHVRIAAADALGRIKDPRAVEALIAVLEDDNPNVRNSAAKSLGDINDRRAVNPLIALLQDESADVRMTAANMLNKLDWHPKSLIENLDYLFAMQKWDEIIRFEDDYALDYIIGVLEYSDLRICISALNSLQKIKDPRAVDVLIAALKYQNSIVRRCAAKFLGDIKDPRAVNRLIGLLKDEDPDVRVEAADALGRIKDPLAVEPLIEALKDTNRFYYDETAIPDNLMNDSRSIVVRVQSRVSVSMHALESLKKITGENFGIEQHTWQSWWEQNKKAQLHMDSSTKQLGKGDDNQSSMVPYDEPPKPIGGLTAIQRNLTYPEIALRAGVEGTVIVEALIDVHGKVRKTRVKKSLGLTGCDEAAIDAIRSVRWKPAIREGKPVRAWVSVPIHFKLKSVVDTSK